MVFTVLFVTTGLVTDIGIGRQRVDKQKVVWLYCRVVVRLCKEEVAYQWSVDEDTAQTWCIVATG